MTDLNVKSLPVESVLGAETGADPTKQRGDGFESRIGQISMTTTEAGYVAYAQFQRSGGVWVLYSRCVARGNQYWCTQERADGKKMSDVAVSQRLKNFSEEVMSVEYKRTVQLHVQKLREERETNKRINEALLNQGAELGQAKKELEELRAASGALLAAAIDSGASSYDTKLVAALIARHLRSVADQGKTRVKAKPPIEGYDLAP